MCCIISFNYSYIVLYCFVFYYATGWYVKLSNCMYMYVCVMMKRYLFDTGYCVISYIELNTTSIDKCSPRVTHKWWI